jgi:hypothetical protein
MNRRGFFAVLASLPFVPKALAVSATSETARAETLLSGFSIERAYIRAYREDLARAMNARYDSALLRAFKRSDWQ